VISAKLRAVSVSTWIGLSAWAAAGLMAPASLASPVPPSPAAASARPLLSTADRASFKRLERSLGGRSGVAVSALWAGRLPLQTAGTMQTAVAWSTSKIPVAMAVYAAGDEAAQRSNLRRAITASDNAAAERLWDSLGGGKTAADAATTQLRRAGDRRTVVQGNRALLLLPWVTVSGVDG